MSDEDQTNFIRTFEDSLDSIVNKEDGVNKESIKIISTGSLLSVFCQELIAAREETAHQNGKSPSGDDNSFDSFLSQEIEKLQTQTKGTFIVEHSVLSTLLKEIQKLETELAESKIKLEKQSRSSIVEKKKKKKRSSSVGSKARKKEETTSSDPPLIFDVEKKDNRNEEMHTDAPREENRKESGKRVSKAALMLGLAKSTSEPFKGSLSRSLKKSSSDLSLKSLDRSSHNKKASSSRSLNNSFSDFSLGSLDKSSHKKKKRSSSSGRPRSLASLLDTSSHSVGTRRKKKSASTSKAKSLPYLLDTSSHSVGSTSTPRRKKKSSSTSKPRSVSSLLDSPPPSPEPLKKSSSHHSLTSLDTSSHKKKKSTRSSSVPKRSKRSSNNDSPMAENEQEGGRKSKRGSKNEPLGLMGKVGKVVGKFGKQKRHTRRIVDGVFSVLDHSGRSMIDHSGRSSIGEDPDDILDVFVITDEDRNRIIRTKSKRMPSRQLKELDSKFEPPRFEKPESDKILIRAEIERCFLSQDMDENILEELVMAFGPAPVFLPGEEIVKQGEAAEHFCIIKAGSVDYEIDGTKYGSAGKYDSFGGLALLYDTHSPVTVRATSCTLLYRVDQKCFRYMLQSQVRFKQLWKKGFRAVQAANRIMVSNKSLPALQEDEVEREPKGEPNIEPKADGEVKEKEKVKDKESKVEQDAKVQEERSSIHSNIEPNIEPKADGEVKEKVKDKDKESKVEQDAQVQEERSSINSVIRKQNFSLQSFTRSEILGEGQFGEVWNVKLDFDKEDFKQFDLEDWDEKTLRRANYALKIQSKTDLHRQVDDSELSPIEAIQREVDIMSKLSYPFIVEFINTFEDNENIYMLMERVNGKELWDLIHRQDENGDWQAGLPESHAKFYSLAIVDTLNYIHGQRIIFRDLKPPNIMVDEFGYPIILDFGCAKILVSEDGQTFTFCGTPDYTCPEIISCQGHSYGVDHWALGIVIYEMISGENPFFYEGISQIQLLNDISNNPLYPLGEKGSSEVNDLIESLLKKDPAERLGSKGGEEILLHRWFDGVGDIEKARTKELSAPWLPPK